MPDDAPDSGDAAPSAPTALGGDASPASIGAGSPPGAAATGNLPPSGSPTPAPAQAVGAIAKAQELLRAIARLAEMTVPVAGSHTAEGQLAMHILQKIQRHVKATSGDGSNQALLNMVKQGLSAQQPGAPGPGALGGAPPAPPPGIGGAMGAGMRTPLPPSPSTGPIPQMPGAMAPA